MDMREEDFEIHAIECGGGDATGENYMWFIPSSELAMELFKKYNLEWFFFDTEGRDVQVVAPYLVIEYSINMDEDIKWSVIPELFYEDEDKDSIFCDPRKIKKYEEGVCVQVQYHYMFDWDVGDPYNAMEDGYYGNYFGVEFVPGYINGGNKIIPLEPEDIAALTNVLREKTIKLIDDGTWDEMVDCFGD